MTNYLFVCLNMYFNDVNCGHTFYNRNCVFTRKIYPLNIQKLFAKLCKSSSFDISISISIFYPNKYYTMHIIFIASKLLTRALVF